MKIGYLAGFSWLWLLIALLTFTLSSCEYEPKGENFVDVPQKDTVIIDLEVIPNDSVIIIAEGTSITYNISPSTLLIHEVKTYLNDSLIDYGIGNHVNFYINPDLYTPGSYIMTLKIVTSTGSGSLGDLLGAEVARFEKTWTVYIDSGYPNPVNILSVTNDYGRIKIDWESYSRVNFHYYFLEREVYEYGNWHKRRECKIFDSTSYYIDSTCLGGNVRYTITVFALNHSLGAEGNQMEFNTTSPTFTINSDKDFNYIFKWSKCMLGGNLDRYELHSVYNYHDSILFQSDQAGDTVFTMPGGLYPEKRFTLYWISDESVIFSQDIEEMELFFRIGDEFTYFEKSSHSTLPDVYIYGLSSDNIYRVDGFSGEIIDQRDNLDLNGISVSPNNVYLCGFHSKTIYLFEPLELGQNWTVNIEDFIGQCPNISSLKVANDGTLLVRCGNIFTNLSLILGGVVFSQTIDGLDNFDSFDLSPEGNYFLTYESESDEIIVYDISTGPIQSFESLGLGFRPPRFLLDSNPEKLLTIKNNTVEIRDCSNQSIINSFSAPVSYIFDIDPYTNYAFAKDSDNQAYYILSLGDGLIKKIIHASSYSSTVNIALVNSILYYGNVKINIEY